MFMNRDKVRVIKRMNYQSLYSNALNRSKMRDITRASNIYARLNLAAFTTPPFVENLSHALRYFVSVVFGL